MPPASLSFGASLDSSAARCALLSANRDEGFELLRLARDRSRASIADRIEQRRAQTIARLNQADQRPGSVAAAHPDGDGVRGPSLCRQRLGRARDPADAHGADRSRQRAASLLIRNGLVVAAVGDIDAAELSRQLDRTFGGLPAGAGQAGAARLDAARPSRAPSSSSGRCRKARC